MTILEASQLIMQASAMVKQGDVFVLDMGEPIKILDLALNMIKLNGKQYLQASEHGDGIHIEITELRPDEKIFEELFNSGEAQNTEIEKSHSGKRRQFRRAQFAQSTG